MKHLLTAAACAALLASAPAFAQNSPDTASPSVAPLPSASQPSTATPPSSGCQPGQVLQANGQPCPAIGSAPSTAAAPLSPSPGATPPSSTAQSPTTIIVTPTTPPAATATAPSRPSATTAPTTSTAAVKFIDRQSDNQYLASNMMGKAVQNSAGERIGTVKDILFDQQGNMSAVVIGFGGFLGIGEKSVGIPFEMVKASKDANGNLMLMASLDKDAINSAPDFLTLEDLKSRSPTAPGASPSNPSRP